MSQTVVKQSELDPKLKSLWLKALSAMELRNHEYASSLLHNVLAQEPRFLEGRKTLRQSQIERKRGEKKSFFSFSGGGLKLSSGKKDPNEAMVEAEKHLDKDPHNIAINQALYEAAQKLGMTETAAFALETIRQGHPDNTRNLHHLAEHYLSMDDPEKAADVYNDITRKDPTDMDAIKGSKDASARASMKKGGWEQATGVKDLLRDKEGSAQLESEGRAAMTKDQLRERLVQYGEAYQANPNDLAAVRKIAETYEKLEELGSALEYYDWALKLSPEDVALKRKVDKLRDRHEENEIRRMEAELDADPHSEGAAERRARLDAIRSERDGRLITAASDRVRNNPTDKQLRFEYGYHLFNAKRYTEAIPELQQARANPHLRIRAMLLLGRCFVNKNMLDMAESTFSEAARELTAMDNTKKEIVYELGEVYERMGDSEKSLECMKEIYNSDYGYKDVAKRVESSYQ